MAVDATEFHGGVARPQIALFEHDRGNAELARGGQGTGMVGAGLSEQHDGVDPMRVDQPGQHLGPLAERALKDVGIQGAAVEVVTGLEDDATHLRAAPLQPQRQAIEEGAHGPLQQQHAAGLQEVGEGRIAGHRLGSRIQRTATSGRMGNQGEHGDRCEYTGICRLGPGGTAV